PLALAADRGLPYLAGHRLAHLVSQDERGLVLRPEIAAERQHALAFDLIAEDRDGHQVGPQRHLVEREEGAAGHAEILAAGFAAPARRTVRPARHVNRRAAAMWAIRIAVVVLPAQPNEGPLDLLLRHARDERYRERPGGC